MTSFSIQPFLDRQPIRSIHVVVLALCTAIMFIDGLDIFMVGKIAPAIAAGMGEPTAAMTKVFVFQQVGLAIGAFVASPMADRFGRRSTLIVSAAIFGSLTVACAFASTLLQLAVLRGLAGIFLSGVLPMAIALISEVTPRFRRGTFIAIAMTGYSLGNAAGGAVAAWLIDIYGWQSGFWIGGLVPLAIIPLMLLLLPESLQYLTGRNPNDPRIPAMLKRFDARLILQGDEVFVADDGRKSSRKSTPLDIFRDGKAGASAILWSVCFLSMGNIALVAAWLPTLFQEKAGVPIQQFAVVAMIAYTGSLVGTLIVGWLINRFSPTRLIALVYLLQSACIVALAQIGFGSIGFVFAFLAFSFCQTGGQAALNLLLAQTYPAHMRATGIGWAGGMGRIGGVIGPLLGGMAVASGLSLSQSVSLIALAPLCVSIIIIMFFNRVSGASPSAEPTRTIDPVGSQPDAVAHPGRA